MPRLAAALLLVAAASACGVAPDPLVVAAHEVRACMRDHGLTYASEVREEQGVRPVLARTTYRSCAWPPPSWAFADGYAEIAVTTYLWDGHAEVTGASAPDLVASTCDAVELVYRFAKMGPEFIGPPLRAAAGAQLRVTGEPWQPEGIRDTLPFATGPRDVVVLHNLSYRVVGARCLP